jgi:hypothetical protein
VTWLTPGGTPRRSGRLDELHGGVSRHLPRRWTGFKRWTGFGSAITPRRSAPAPARTPSWGRLIAAAIRRPVPQAGPRLDQSNSCPGRHRPLDLAGRRGLTPGPHLARPLTADVRPGGSPSLPPGRIAAVGFADGLPPLRRRRGVANQRRESKGRGKPTGDSQVLSDVKWPRNSPRDDNPDSPTLDYFSKIWLTAGADVLSISVRPCLISARILFHRDHGYRAETA